VEASAVPAPIATVARFLTAADHLRIGASLVVGALLWVVVAALVGVVLGLERLDSGTALVNADALPQLF